MKQRPRIYYTETDKSLMWDRWQKGELQVNETAIDVEHISRHANEDYRADGCSDGRCRNCVTRYTSSA